MKCPHCMIAFHDKPEYVVLGEDADGEWFLVKRRCPSCNRLIILLVKGTGTYAGSQRGSKILADVSDITESIQVRPIGGSRPPCPPEVPKDIAKDYAEACLVLPYSREACAALSRRCLQNLLREVAGVKPDNLSSEIDEAIRMNMRSDLAEQIDAIRNIGNCAAHPTKSKTTGEIVPVEPGEAEWNLDILEFLFDYYCVQPAKLKSQKQDMNKKLRDAGRPPMK